MPKFGRWKNHYIDLIKTKPSLLLNFGDKQVGEAEREALSERFGMHDRVLCELGSGSGKHLIELAQRNPAALCIGFETRYKRAFRTVEKAEREGLSNLLLFREKAEQIGEYFAPSSIDAVYVNFPDPWEKLRWKKHRLLKAEFIARLWELLKPDGYLSYKTDHPEYFEETIGIIDGGGLFSIEKHSRNLHVGDPDPSNIFSEFELLFRSKGVAVNYVLCRKIVRPALGALPAAQQSIAAIVC